MDERDHKALNKELREQSNTQKQKDIKFKAYSGDSVAFNIERSGKMDYFLKNWHVVQYTGIKDKKGVEIYDGDILKVKTKHGFNSELLNEFKDVNKLDSINGIDTHFIGVVRVDFLRGLMFENLDNGYKEPMFSRHIDIFKYHSDIEVVGNIYSKKYSQKKQQK